MTAIQCKNCNKTFTVDQLDAAFYDKLQVPVPQLCPDCRQQQRCSWRNELYMYQRACDLCNKTMISLYSPDKPYTVYCKDCWWSDKWDPLDYAQDYNPKQLFFEQFHQLNLRVPQLGFISSHCENSDYCTYSVYYKDSYMCITGVVGEHIYYGFFVNESRDSVDCGWSWNLEKCYECIDSKNLYQSMFTQDCEDSSFLNFCYDCVSCTNCLGCVNLRHKDYYYFNKPISPERYQQKLREITSNYAELLNFQSEFTEFQKKFPKPAARTRYSEQSSGNYIYHSRQARDCFDVVNVENSRYACNIPQGASEVYDINYSPKSELSYNSMSIVNGKYVVCAITSWDVQFSEYCWQSFYSNRLFGCVGIKHGHDTILNKQYEPIEYNRLRTSIINQLRQQKVYGDFFPMQFSPFAYNESMAQQWFPLTRSAIERSGLQFKSSDQHTLSQTEGADICIICHKQFRMIPQELQFYDAQQLPQPTKCFQCRLQTRLVQRNPRQLWQRQCMCTQIDHMHASAGSAQVPARCTTEFATTYSPDRKELVYCEACYQKEVY